MVRRLIMSSLYLLLVIPFVYLIFCVVMYIQQDKMVFVPTIAAEPDMDKRATEWGFSPWLNAQGTRIGWQSNEGDPDKVLLVLSGNGGNSLHRVHYRNFTAKEGNWKTYLLEYPGYGARPGTPSEESVVTAAVEALDTLVSPGRQIWVAGESLGSGVASALAARRADKIAGVILVTPFTSLPAAAKYQYSWLPVYQLMKTRFDSVKNLESYHGPVAFIAGKQDDIVPAHLGQRLHDSYQGPKRIWISPDSDHNVSGYLDTEWKDIVSWLQDGARS